MACENDNESINQPLKKKNLKIISSYNEENEGSGYDLE